MRHLLNKQHFLSNSTHTRLNILPVYLYINTQKAIELLIMPSTINTTSQDPVPPHIAPRDPLDLPKDVRLELAYND